MILDSIPKNRLRRAATTIWLVFTMLFIWALYVFTKPGMYPGSEWYIITLYIAVMFGLTWEILFNLSK